MAHKVWWVDGEQALRGALAGVALALSSLGVAAQSVPASGSDEAETWTSDPGHRTDMEGAIGLILKYSPAFPGSSDVSWKASPAGFVRWGRYTVTGAGGFTTQRNREVERGLGAEVARRGALLLNLNVRVDGGRSQSDSPDLTGMGDIPVTLRGRLSARWEPVPQWVVTSGVAVDLLHKVGGVNFDAGVQREWLLAPGQRFILGAGFSAADRTYMQAWHGVTAEQALHASYAPYRASAGLRGLFASATYRYEVDHTWAAFAGVSHSRLVGSAAESPLTRRPEETSWQAGVARRF